MKIMITGSVNDYSCYEEQQLAAALTEELKAKGHMADYFVLPYKPEALSLPDQMLIYKMLDVSGADMLITIGYPACTINHPNKVSYLLETAPMLHEYWDSEYGLLGNYQYSQILISVNKAERDCFRQTKRLICGSRLLKSDIETRYGITAEYLPLPLLEAKEISSERIDSSGYYVTESCLLQNSRYYEFVKQLAETPKVNVCIFVPNADPVYANSLTELIAASSAVNRIRVISGEPADEILKNAAGYVHFPYMSRRPENVLNRCAKLGVPVIAADDCGCASEMAQLGLCITMVPFDKLCSTMNGSIKVGSATEVLSVSDFTQKVVNV